jgi:DegT/DnrJ/EryC1/StrS aminotransferase family
MGKLVITGGDVVRTTPFPVWPLGKEEEARNLQDVLESSRWGGQPFPGKYALAFAKKFAEAHTAKYGQCVNTGTVAIQAALKAIDIRPGDEVIVPAYTWEGTVGPVLLVNAVPVSQISKSCAAWIIKQFAISGRVARSARVSCPRIAQLNLA